LDIAQRDREIADVERQNAEARVDFLAARVDIVVDRRLNENLYYALAERFEQLAEEHVALAVRRAYLYERAVAFFLGQPDIAEIRFEYRDASGELLTAPSQLRADLLRVRDRFTEAEVKQDDFKAEFSLRADYPLEFARFQQGEPLEFALSLYQLEKRFPGTYQVRIIDVRIEIRGSLPAIGFDGTLTHMGRFLLRDRPSTLSPDVQRLVPTDDELAAAIARQREGGESQAAVGGVIPYALDPDTAQINPAESTLADGSQEITLGLFEGFGPTGLWQLDLGPGNRSMISDIRLHLNLRTAETDVFALQDKIVDLVAGYEAELTGGDELDRVMAIGLRSRFPDAFDDLAGGTATITLREEDFDRSDVRVKSLLLQALDADGLGIGGLQLEISRPGTSFTRNRTTGPDGFSEDLSTGEIEVTSTADRLPGPGAWQVRLPDLSAFAGLGELRLFFIYTFGGS
jgi:hypothetical protein